MNGWKDGMPSSSATPVGISIRSPQQSGVGQRVLPSMFEKALLGRVGRAIAVIMAAGAALLFEYRAGRARRATAPPPEKGRIPA